MTAAELLAEMTTRAANARNLSDVLRYGALKTITEEAFTELSAGVIVGLFEALTKDEVTSPRASSALSLCADLKVTPIDPETFLFFGAGLWTITARMMLNGVKNETDNGTRALLLEVVDELLQDSGVMLIDFVKMVPTRAVQDVVSTDVSAEVAGDVP